MELLFLSPGIIIIIFLNANLAKDGLWLETILFYTRMPCVSRVHFLSVKDKKQALKSEMNEEQIDEGKGMIHMPCFFSVFSEMSGMDVREADATL